MLKEKHNCALFCLVSIILIMIGSKWITVPKQIFENICQNFDILKKLVF